MSHIGELCSHDFLSFDHIRCYAGNRSFIANRASQDDIDVATDASVHHALGQYFLMHGSGDSARLANYIDGTQMVLLPSSREGKIGTHSRLRSVQGAFYVVSRK